MVVSDHITDIAYYGDRTDFAIGWTSRTDYNLISGRSPAGPECDHCYAADMALRLAARMADFMSRLYERDGMLHLAPAPLPAIEQVEVPNVWLGVTPGTQGSASRQLPALVKVKATVRFVSMEPLLEPVNLDTYIQALDWIIVSGESGLGWRPMDLD